MLFYDFVAFNHPSLFHKIRSNYFNDSFQKMEILNENIRRAFYVGNLENKISFYVFLSAG